MSPPWIAADKEVRDLLAARDRLYARARHAVPASRGRLQAELARLVADTNRAIARVNAEAPIDRQHRRPLDLAAESAGLDSVLGADR